MPENAPSIAAADQDPAGKLRSRWAGIGSMDRDHGAPEWDAAMVTVILDKSVSDPLARTTARRWPL